MWALRQDELTLLLLPSESSLFFNATPARRRNAPALKTAALTRAVGRAPLNHPSGAGACKGRRVVLKVYCEGPRVRQSKANNLTDLSFSRILRCSRKQITDPQSSAPDAHVTYVNLHIEWWDTKTRLSLNGVPVSLIGDPMVYYIILISCLVPAMMDRDTVIAEGHHIISRAPWQEHHDSVTSTQEHQ